MSATPRAIALETLVLAAIAVVSGATLLPHSASAAIGGGLATFVSLLGFRAFARIGQETTPPPADHGFQPNGGTDLPAAGYQENKP